MPKHDIICIGASAGGFPALVELAGKLPPDLPAAVFVVVHTSPDSPGVLPRLLERSGPLPAEFAIDGEVVRHSRIYIAPPDQHLLIKDGRMILTRGPKENGFRPAVDPLFRTAAKACGPRVVGVVLSGGLDDGTDGLQIIRACGGIAVAQDPDEAMQPSMPASAIQNVGVDYVLPVAGISATLAKISRQTAVRKRGAPVCNGQDEPDAAEAGTNMLLNNSKRARELPGNPTVFTCPECGGSLWELKKARLVKYRCHLGHSYTEDGLLNEQERDLENALWGAVRSLEENAELKRRMARRSERWTWIAKSYQQQAEEADRKAMLVRKALLRNEQGPTEAQEKTSKHRAERSAQAGDGQKGKRRSGLARRRGRQKLP